MSKSDLEVRHVGWRSSMRAETSLLVRGILASGTPGMLAHCGQLQMSLAEGWEQQPCFWAPAPPASGFPAAVQSENKPKCSTKGQQAQRPPACCRLSRTGSGTAPAARAYPPPAGRLPKFPPPLPSLGCASLGMLRMGLSWDVSSGVAVLMEEALWALG